MPTIQPQVDTSEGRSIYATWPNLLNGDDGAPINAPGHQLVSMQVLGTAGAGLALQAQGSNQATPTVWGNLLAAAVSALGMTLFPAGVAARNVRPIVTAGDGTTSVTVIALFQRGA